MAYSNAGYLRRAKAIQELTLQHYERGRHDKCLKRVWRKYILPIYGLTYKAYLNNLTVDGFKDKLIREKEADY